MLNSLVDSYALGFDRPSQPYFITTCSGHGMHADDGVSYDMFNVKGGDEGEIHE
jgi:hypothetical protein